MGPCTIDPFEQGARVGICGANKDTIVARNLARKIAAGVSAHSEHGREMALALLKIGEGLCSNKEYVWELAKTFNIKEGQSGQVVLELAKAILGEFSKQEELLVFPFRAPEQRIKTWKRGDMLPFGIDREIVELLHRTNMGVDTDPKSLILKAMRVALADGWGGSMIATELSDLILGFPSPIRSKVNLGVIKEEMVNIIVHGHEPLLADAVVKSAKDPELISMANKYGAEGINVVGMCCTANEVLMRKGIPVAGNFLQQELAIITGAVEVLMVDVQCIMPSLKEVCSCYHTKLLTTSRKARFPLVQHIEFQVSRAEEVAKEIIKEAIKNFPHRNRRYIEIPREEIELVAGFTARNYFSILGGSYRYTYSPLNEAIISGRLKGVVGVVGCNNPKIVHDQGHVSLVQELIGNDILVIQTGCSAIACAKAGLMVPEAAYSAAGRGLQEICEVVGIPPVLHMGSCVDNSRLLLALTFIVQEGGLGDDISLVPVAGVAPEWMSEKALAIGFYFVGSGVFTVFGRSHPVLGSKYVTQFLTNEIEKVVGARFAYEVDPLKMSGLIIDHINAQRKRLGLPERFE
jgi:carbon-monoxide dehydrogenase catalytic subunit